MAYSRYADIPEKKDANNRRVRLSTIYPPFPKHPDDTYVLTTVGDTLYALANQYYNSVNYYWVIAEANEGLDKATLNLAPGLQLRIPSQLNQIISDFRDLNNM
jgi:nucleoid-associated protein YgaU